MKDKIFSTICLLLLLVASNNMICAQSSTELNVSGIVTDDIGETLPGASVYIKNKPGVGVITDLDGKFTINASKNDVLVVTFMGFDNVEILVTKDEPDLKIKLTESNTVMEEVVVVGHGQQRKVSVIGSVSTVDVKELKSSTSSITNTLAGRVAGIIAVQRSGEPGNDFSEFWIRGISTFGANQGALILVDGVERNSINEIDPEDIESFSVLKDASATAVYGVRGANGVVLITTKRGVAGKLSIRFKNSLTFSQTPNKPKYLRSYEYAKLANEASIVRGNKPIYNDVELDIIKNHLDLDLYPDVDWQKELFKDYTWTRNHYLNISGGEMLLNTF